MLTVKQCKDLTDLKNMWRKKLQWNFWEKQYYEELPHPACSINIKPKRSLKLSILHLRFVQEKGALITCMQLKNG
ncbi:hypothetical protein Anapl_15200 [Anas platyrhynchos]|uniref:Uncharacterized protein n=1 Tax=Anas platyrhynchos TaxID=8839 RepID=R0KRV1_ANAPL|nr:hypothetical protein Anapl_15200 [Anas platyrhynchos]